MSVAQERADAVRDTMVHVKTALSVEATVDTIERAKSRLMDLVARTELFPRADFPMPEGEQTDRTFHIYSEPDGQFALYAVTAIHGMTYRPHNHGNAWAIVAAVEGQERHYFYERTDDGSDDSKGRVRQVGELIVEPGVAVSILEGGIHSIETANRQPLLHLHCYGWAFHKQTARLEFDMASGTSEFNNDVGRVEDVPLMPAAAY